MATVADILTESVSLLNDTNKVLYTDAKLMPFLQKAYRELELELHNNGAPLLNEISSVINVPANTDTLPNLPDDLVIPIRLRERANGAEQFIDMEERYWEPTYERGPSLRYWSWREGEIKLLGATTARQVIIYYRKSAASLTTTTSSITYDNAILYMAPRTAALAAGYIGNNFDIARSLQSDAKLGLDMLLSRTVKQGQNLSSRRRSYWQFLRIRRFGGGRV